jgi:hypothetical protein
MEAVGMARLEALVAIRESSKAVELVEILIAQRG